MHKYVIDGKTYEQRPLVLGQLALLVELLENKDIADMTPYALMRAFGDSLPRCVAVILIPDGESVKGRDIDAIEEIMRYHMDIDTAMQVVTDFFICNPLPSISGKLRAVVGAIWQTSTET